MEVLSKIFLTVSSNICEGSAGLHIEKKYQSAFYIQIEKGCLQKHS